MIGRNDACWCGSGKKWKKCHFPRTQITPDFNHLKEQYFKEFEIVLKTPEQIKKIRRASQLAAQILDALCRAAQAGVTTNALNALAEKLHKEAGAIAAPLHYGSPPYPKSICTSLNEIICHGIPNDTPLKEGDILNIDVSVFLDGAYGDCSRMVKIGTVDPEKELVCTVALECLNRAIAILKPGVLLSQIGDVIEECAAHYHCSVVDQFVAHGIGLEFHEAPQVPHHRNHVHIPLVPGMTFTIEPMINAGVKEAVIDPTNQWEASTLDGKPSAQWEHTLLITERGYQILTALEG